MRPEGVIILIGCLASRATAQRHNFDARCPSAVTLDPPGKRRDPTSTSKYLTVQLPPDSTIEDCIDACCRDWSCITFEWFGANSTCSFRDDIDALVPSAGVGVTTGKRGLLPAKPMPLPASHISAVLNKTMVVGINGDEFPISWAEDGKMYTGAGDNRQKDSPSSPLAFFSVQGGPTEMGCDAPPTHHDQPSPTCKNVSLRGDPIPIKAPTALKACSPWEGHKTIPNLKSSGVLALDGVLYWIVSCFNYGDDKTFNRQRYGPAWIVTSRDRGATWNETATPTDFFTGRLAAPRFLQMGRAHNESSDGFVYLYFPGTTGGAAFFENNDQMLLGRVRRHMLLNRSAYDFFTGTRPDGSPTWSTDDTIAVPVVSFPLMLSVQQATWVPAIRRIVFANWAWISVDGAPRPDHSPDERNERTGHQRTQLTLVEAATPWGPFNVFWRDDDWRGSDGSSGGYTPVVPSAWVSDHDFWLAFTQCCGNPRPPLNHYNFNLQRVTFTSAKTHGATSGPTWSGAAATPIKDE